MNLIKIPTVEFACDPFTAIAELHVAKYSFQSQWIEEGITKPPSHALEVS